jgi:hypothetical protein
MKSMKIAPLVLVLLTAIPASAQNSELDQMKNTLQQMQKTIDEMQKKILELEKEKAEARTPSAIEKVSPSYQTLEKIAAGQDLGHPSQIEQRPALNDQQEGAPRPRDHTLDPKYRGFIPVPHTPGLIRFNAKPRVDMTSDTRNSGNADRFATADIPVEGESDYGGSERFNINARGSQLSVDVRAPDMPGDFRFYYQNDFFGSGGGMAYRLRHIYGQIYNFTAGYTFSCFEDPDAWPDTVDYEGPNSAIFARRALGRYLLPLSEAWQLNFGIEAPGTEVDDGSAPTSIEQENRLPDGTMNVRWENAKWGHVQLGTVARDLGAKAEGIGSEHDFGWGFNLASSINVYKRDSVQAQLTYGEGIFRYMNDNFSDNDAAFDEDGDLKALPVFAAMVGYTHHWTDVFRSTATFGYVNLENERTQGPFAYDKTYYGSANIVWQLRKRLSVGLEGLYGKKETQNGNTGDVWRTQIGMVYSLFD